MNIQPVAVGDPPTGMESDSPMAVREADSEWHLQSSVGPVARRHGRVARATHRGTIISVNAREPRRFPYAHRSAAFMPLQRAEYGSPSQLADALEPRTVKRHKCRAPLVAASPRWEICRLALGCVLLVLSISSGFAQSAQSGLVHFQAVDVYVNSKEIPLAAYQLEFKSTNGLVKIVGIEGGEHAAFKEAPFYDAKAIQHERVIIAAFSTGENLPKGRTRVATIHLQISGDPEPAYVIKAAIAADGTGTRIPIEATFRARQKP